MSLKLNILASYVGQFYVMLISIAMVPLYLRYMGTEPYGLVGFFAMLQAWFQLLDLGLTPTMARETARFNGGATDAHSLRRLLRALEVIFIGVAVLAATGVIIGANFVAADWLKVQNLPLEKVKQAIQLMAIIIALRLVCGLYRATVTGFEKLVWLSTFNILIATLKFVLIIPFFIFVSADFVDFFRYQLAVAIAEFVILLIRAYRFLPDAKKEDAGPWVWGPLLKVLKFSFSVAFTSSVWVLVTQTDKLMLSKLLGLSQYAYFTLAVLVASGVTVITGPIASALMPRLARLSAECDEEALITLYRQATQLVGVVAIPASLILAVFSEKVLWAWTGDSVLVSKVAPILTLYALGNGILALGAFPYYLQFAKGDLRLHMIGNIFFLLLLVPTLIWATSVYGMLGAGYTWLGINIVYFALWVPQVHRHLVTGLHFKWLADLGPIALFSVLVAGALHLAVDFPASRALGGVYLAIIGLLALMAAAIGSSFCRHRMQALCIRLVCTYGARS